MKCLECQTEIPDTALSCPRCGTPTRTTTSFSYLPAGAPPWPTTALASTATAVKQVAESVTPSTSKKMPDAKPKRSAGSVISAILLLILSVVVGVGATLAILTANGSLVSPGTTSTQSAHLATPAATTAVATPTSGTGTPAATPTTGAQGNQLPTPSSFVAVKIAEVGVSLKYPADWSEKAPQTDNSGVIVSFAPQQQNGIEFFVEQFSKSSQTHFTNPDQVNQSELQQFSTDKQFSNYHEVSPNNPSPTIAGTQWTERDAMFNNGNGVVFHITSISVQHNNVYYNIFFSAFSDTYAEAMQKYYSQMLTSFQFLS